MVQTRISFNYLVKRLAVSLFVVWAVLTLLFLMLKSMPGNVSQLLLNPNLKESARQALIEQYGLNQPLWKQYLKWVYNYLTFNFGHSFLSPEPVSDMIMQRMPRTLVLFGTATLLNYTIGVIAGIYFGWKRGSTTDITGFIGGLTLYSVPFFWIAWLLLLVFHYSGFGPQWLPGGYMVTTFDSVFSIGGLVTDVLWHMILPAGSLVVVGWAGAMLVMRTSMQEVVDAPYIETARAKGLSPASVKYKHAARNALIPVATQAIVGIAFIIDGSVIIESVFSWPGMGELLITAVLQRDFPVALAAFFMLGVLIVVLRLVTDVVYTFLDPRIKFGEAQ